MYNKGEVTLFSLASSLAVLKFYEHMGEQSADEMELEKKKARYLIWGIKILILIIEILIHAGLQRQWKVHNKTDFIHGSI